MTLFIPLLKVDKLGTNSIRQGNGAILSPDGSSDSLVVGLTNNRELNDFSDRISAVSIITGFFVRERQRGMNFRRKVYLILLAG
jgi:hypothetical protein